MAMFTWKGINVMPNRMTQKKISGKGYLSDALCPPPPPLMPLALRHTV